MVEEHFEKKTSVPLHSHGYTSVKVITQGGFKVNGVRKMFHTFSQKIMNIKV